MKVITGIFRKLFGPAGAPAVDTEEPAFMTFIIKVNPSKSGWQKSIIPVLKNCTGVRFKMDGEGIVEISGVSNPNKLLKKLSRTKNIELHWFQFGQCCTNLFMPEPPKPIAKEQTDNDQDSKQDQPLPLPPHALHPASYDDYAYHHLQIPHQLLFRDDYVYHHLQNPHQLPFGDYCVHQHLQNPLRQVFNPYNYVY